MAPPLAYFITFSSYGTHLPGSEKGWVDAKHSIPGSPVLGGDVQIASFWKARLKEPRLVLEQDQRRIVLDGLWNSCEDQPYTGSGWGRNEARQEDGGF